uniref:Rubicon Homology domain-containing protein n=1 Tax=Gopherus evgoodei TaxID=1825980 RepID=A0A8C4YJ45_9SAUR
MVIPSRILRKWDFSKYYVSNFSRDLLSKIWSDPLFSVQDLNAALYRKVKALNQVRLLRIQLLHLKNMFKTCRLAKELLDSFDTVPGHLTEDLHLYSLNDLNATKKGELVPRLMELIKAGTLHIERCMPRDLLLAQTPLPCPGSQVSRQKSRRQRCPPAILQLPTQLMLASSYRWD